MHSYILLVVSPKDILAYRVIFIVSRRYFRSRKWSILSDIIYRPVAIVSLCIDPRPLGQCHIARSTRNAGVDQSNAHRTSEKRNWRWTVYQRIPYKFQYFDWENYENWQSIQTESIRRMDSQFDRFPKTESQIQSATAKRYKSRAQAIVADEDEDQRIQNHPVQYDGHRGNVARIAVHHCET